MSFSFTHDNPQSVEFEGEHLPFVSVIMPIRNEEAFIDRCLSAVLGQDYPHNKMEVLAADGMSTDLTRDVISRLIANQDIQVTVLDNLAQIVPTAMNIAIRRARGEVIIRVDGHVVIQKDYVRRCVEWLINNDADCVGGVVESVGSGYVGKAIAVAMSSPFGVGGSSFRTLSGIASPILTDTLPFGAYRRDVFDRVGLFNEQMVRHQDYEFCYRLRKAGGRIMLLPSIRAAYFVRSKLKDLWKQYWQYGIWKGRFLRAYPASLKLRHLVPPLFVFVLAVSGLLALFAQLGLWALSFSLGAYVIFIFCALITLGRKNNLKYMPILPVVLACLHVSWGIGIWLGIFSPKLSSPKANNLT